MTRFLIVVEKEKNNPANDAIEVFYSNGGGFSGGKYAYGLPVLFLDGNIYKYDLFYNYLKENGFEVCPEYNSLSFLSNIDQFAYIIYNKDGSLNEVKIIKGFQTD